MNDIKTNKLLINQQNNNGSIGNTRQINNDGSIGNTRQINNDGSINNTETQQINNNLPTDNLIDNIHNQSIITMVDATDIINKPSFSMKDLSVGSDRKKLTSNGSINNVNGYNGEKDLFNFDNVQSPYDIINTNTIKSILQTVNSNTFMMYEDDNYQDNYFELGVNNNENVSSNETQQHKKRQVLNTPSELKKDNKIFHLLGVAFNEYYNQYYLVYENIIKTNADNNYVEDNLNNMRTQVAEYILAKIKDKDSIEIVHEIGPRNKINNNDVVYFAYGNFQLGPLMLRFI
jgi:hypothetical protein